MTTKPMRRTLRTATVACLIMAGSGVVLTGTASASTPAERRTDCSPNIHSNDVPTEWIPRSAAEQDRRVRWDQVRAWDKNRDGKLSDAEIATFRAGRTALPGGPACDRPTNPPRKG